MADAAFREIEWPAPEVVAGARIEKTNFAAAALAPQGFTLISGDLDAAIRALAPGAPKVGFAAEIGADAHALRIAREKALLATPAPLDADPGWRAEGFCASAADGAWTAFEISGPGAAHVIAQGTPVDPNAGSASAAALFAGRTALVSRSGDAFRLVVETAFREYYWEWLAGAD